MPKGKRCTRDHDAIGGAPIHLAEAAPASIKDQS